MPETPPRMTFAQRLWGLIRSRLAGAVCVVAVVAGASEGAAQTFPALTGRVVDEAGILQPAQRSALDAKLKAHEDKTTDQIVVATVRSLGGTSIEDYANRLYREWKLGTREKNNGALLLVAPNDRKVRIEVGYGLEGALTDALSGIVIRTAIAPRFKVGDFAGGINAGVDAILSVLTGDAEEWQRRREIRPEHSGKLDWITLLFVGFVLFMILRAMFRSSRGMSRAYRRRNGGWIVLPPSSGWGGGWSGVGGSFGGGGFSGGFSGGGGSSGGGGASGSW